MKSKPEIMTLCHNCRAAFENTDAYYVKRVDPNQTVKEKCGYCSVRSGYDYMIIPKHRKERR